MRWILIGLASALIGVVVLQAKVDVVFRHFAAFEAPAIARTALNPEDILVVKDTPDSELVLRPIPNQVDLLLGNAVVTANYIGKFLLWKESESVRDLRRGETKVRAKRLIDRQDLSAWRAYKNINRWRHAVVFLSRSEDLIRLTEMLHDMGDNSDISAQLAFFGILSDGSLKYAGTSGTGGCYRGTCGGVNSRMIKPMAFLILGVVGVFWSIRHLILLRTRVVRYGVLFVVSWIFCVLGTFLGLAALSENVDVSSYFDASAARYSGSKDVHVIPVVVPELKLRDVQRHVLGADLVERANNAALHQRPETFNRVRVHGTNNIFLSAVTNEGVRIFLTEFIVSPQVVGREQTDFVGHGFLNESDKGIAVEAFDDARNHLALALHSADDADLAGTRAASTAAALVPMLIFVLPSDVGLIDFDNAAQLIRPMLTKARADAVAHIERGLVRAEAHEPHDLQGANALLTGQHEVNDLEPVPQRLVRVLEDRPDQNGEAVAALFGALSALPMEGAIGDGVHVNVPAAGTVNAFRPTAGLQVLLASRLVGKHRFELGVRKLLDGFDFRHDRLSQPMGGSLADG